MTALVEQAEQENPLVEGLRLLRTPEPCAIVIFGASGDLAKRKLFPALYALAFRNLLPTSFAIVGSARTPMSDDEFRTRLGFDGIGTYSMRASEGALGHRWRDIVERAGA